MEGHLASLGQFRPDLEVKPVHVALGVKVRLNQQIIFPVTHFNRSFQVSALHFGEEKAPLFLCSRFGDEKRVCGGLGVGKVRYFEGF